MFKRAIWMGAGFGAGLGSSFWVKRAVNRRVQRYVPTDVRSAAVTRARAATSNVRAAVNEGRTVMRQYQADAEAKVNKPNRPKLRAVPD
ncbi:MAG: hypothetical protein ACR2PK_08745 [Acidimicrobiales bacterium]